ncbi:MAG: histidine kinase [Actinomycetota bacterium]|nr:histidine kinase [Actinomycetota bacterium]
MEGQLYELLTIYENVPIGLALLDNELKFLRINKKFSDFNGKPEQDYLGRQLPQVIPELPQTITKDIIQGKNPVLNINFKRNGQKSKEFWQLECYPLKNSIAKNKKFLVLLKNITQKRIEERARLKYTHQKIVKMEKKKLAKELHDTVIQILFSSNLLAESLAKSWKKNPQKAIKEMDRIGDLNKAALLEMQILLYQLTPEKIANESLEDLIGRQIDAIDRRSDITFEMQVTGNHEFGYKVKHEVYRIAQETLNNIVKHSEATRVKIHLSLSPSILKFCISDNGTGFDIKDRSTKRNMGINIMKERSKVINASLSISSKKGEGTSITLVYPGSSAK